MPQGRSPGGLLTGSFHKSEERERDSFGSMSKGVSVGESSAALTPAMNVFRKGDPRANIRTIRGMQEKRTLRGSGPFHRFLKDKKRNSAKLPGEMQRNEPRTDCLLDVIKSLPIKKCRTGQFWSDDVSSRAPISFKNTIFCEREQNKSNGNRKGKRV